MVEPSNPSPVRAGRRRAAGQILLATGACLLGGLFLAAALWPRGPWDDRREEADLPAPQIEELAARQEKPAFVAPDEERRFAAAEEARLCAFDAGGQVLAWIAGDRKVSFRSLDGARTVSRELPDRDRLTRLALAPDGSLAAVLDSFGRVYLVSATHAQQPRYLTYQSDARLLAFSPDARLLALAGTQEVHLWHVPSGAPRGQFPFPPSLLIDLRFTQEGHALAIATTRGFRILSLDQGVFDELEEFRRANGIALSPCGGILAVGTRGGEVFLFELNPQEEIARLDCTPGLLLKPLTFSPDGRLLLTLSEDGVLLLHDALTGQVKERLGRPGDSVLAAAFQGSGGKVVGATTKGVVSTWSLKDLVIRQTRPLSAAQREQAWGNLAKPGAVGNTALGRLLDDSGPMLAFVQERLRPPGVETELHGKIRSALIDLDSNDLPTRLRASATLAEIGPPAQAGLEGAVSKPASEEVHQRAQALLARLETHWPENRRRWQRVFRLLELRASDGAALLLGELDSPQQPQWIRLRARQGLTRLLRRGVVRPPWVE